KIKQIPEDFIVREISGIRPDENGLYSYFLLKKKNYNTLRAVQKIAEKLGINEKKIGFAGNKDKNALTEQTISISPGNKSIENVKIKDIWLKYLGKGNEEIYLGNLKGNSFEITVRNLAKSDIEKIKENVQRREIFAPNYFGEQRLSNSNSLIGESIIKNNFKEAINLILGSNTDYNEKIKAHLQKQKNDFVGALKIVPFKLLKLYVHSYQSFLFNKALEQYIELNKKNNNNNKIKFNEKLPIVGFGTELESNDTGKIIKEILKEEKIELRDFIIRAIPDLSSEGAERDAFMRIESFEILSCGKDELNKGKEKMTVEFFLPKGCYATVLVDYLFK
ncbi:tRNA pseudouridine(13) synthase TruD, partial [Candidatus Woesearchaeota archaeon]|nr:tRNA pseudouridine(13) synthase TruD [Candidatus Woesearchaeota archaeon]